MLAPVNLIDHALFVILAVVLGPRAYLAFRRLRTSGPGEQAARRTHAYRMAMLSQWTLSAALLANWAVNARTWVSLGVVPALTPGVVGVGAGLVIVIGLMMIQNRRPEGRERAMDRARERVRALAFMMPHSARELRLFTALAITAGICEELLFRGFMMWYLAHWTGEMQAALLSSLVFGLGHAYQGPRGILLTGAIGVFMAGIYLLSGSLYLPMLIHAAVDITAGRTGYAVMREEAGATDDSSGAPRADATPA